MATQTTVVSPKWTVQLRDWLNGLWLAIASGISGSVVSLIIDWMKAGVFHVDLERIQSIGVMAVGFGFLYVFKRYSDPTKIISINPPSEDVAALKSGESVTIPPKQ